MGRRKINIKSEIKILNNKIQEYQDIIKEYNNKIKRYKEAIDKIEKRIKILTRRDQS